MDRDATDENQPLLQNGHTNQVKAPAPPASADQPIAETSPDLNADTESNKREGIPEVRARLKYIVPAVGIGIFLCSADQTLVVACYPRIADDLHELSKSSWISTVYFLSLTSFQPLYGKLSDIFGRKPCLLFAYSCFGLGCVFCGLARTMDELIVARAIAGIGGGGMTTVVSILMSDIVPLRERGTWQGIVNIIFASGAGAGAPLGGLMADYVSWRWAFLFQGPLCLLAIVSVGLVLKLPTRDHQDWKTKVRRVDLLGAFVLIAAVFSLLFGLDRGSNYTWSSPLAIVPTCLFVPLAMVFLYIEFKVAPEPLAPKRIVMERNLAACYLCNFFAFAAWMSILFYLPLYYQAVLKYTSSEAGLVLMPAIVASVGGSLTGGIVMQKTGKYYWLTGSCYVISALAVIPLVLCAGLVVTSAVGVGIALVFSGFGNGVGVTTTLISLIANASPDDVAIVTACSYLFRSSGSVIGLSLASTVVQQSLRGQLENSLPAGAGTDDIVRHVRQSLQYINKLDPDLQTIVRTCYGTATQHGFWFSALLACGAVLFSWFISEKNLNR